MAAGCPRACPTPPVPSRTWSHSQPQCSAPHRQACCLGGCATCRRAGSTRADQLRAQEGKKAQPPFHPPNRGWCLVAKALGLRFSAAAIKKSGPLVCMPSTWKHTYCPGQPNSVVLNIWQGYPWNTRKSATGGAPPHVMATSQPACFWKTARYQPHQVLTAELRLACMLLKGQGWLHKEGWT